MGWELQPRHVALFKLLRPVAVDSSCPIRHQIRLCEEAMDDVRMVYPFLDYFERKQADSWLDDAQTVLARLNS